MTEAPAEQPTAPSSDEGEHADQAGELQNRLAEAVSKERPEDVAHDLAQVISLELAKASEHFSLELVKVSEHFSGPLPPPEMLAQYEKIVPGLAKQIVNRADKEQDFRHEATQYVQRTERKALHHEAAKTYIGQLGAILIAMTTIIGSIWLINKGYSAEGIAGIVAALASLAGVFIVGRLTKPTQEQTSDGSDSE